MKWPRDQFSMDYVGQKPCGCYTVWIAAAYPARDKVRLIAKLKRQGYKIIRCRTEWVRENLRSCHCADQLQIDLGVVGLEA